MIRGWKTSKSCIICGALATWRRVWQWRLYQHAGASRGARAGIEAIAAQRLTQTCLGPMAHTGPKGYLDPDVKTDDGRSYLEVTASAMLAILNARRT